MIDTDYPGFISAMPSTSTEPTEDELIEYSHYADDGIISFMYRDTTGTPLDTLDSVLNNIAYMYDYQITRALVLATLDEHQAAIDLVDGLHNNFDMNEDEEEWMQNIKTVLLVAKDLHDNDYDWAAVDAGLKTDLADIAENDGYFAKELAKAYQVIYEEERYEPVIVWTDEDAGEKPGRLGVNTITDNGYNVYPNPVRETLYIDVSGNTNDVYGAVTDITGKEIMRFALQQGQNSIGVTHLVHGVYLVKIHAGNETVSTTKLVK